MDKYRAVRGIISRDLPVPSLPMRAVLLLVTVFLSTSAIAQSEKDMTAMRAALDQDSTLQGDQALQCPAEKG